MTKTPKLLPCAHCGSTNIHLCRRIVPSKESFEYAWAVECFGCGIQTQAYTEDNPVDTYDDVFNAHNAINEAVECAVATWNHRADKDNECLEDVEASNEPYNPLDKLFADARKELDKLLSIVREACPKGGDK